ncbi:hypothetical protein ACFYT3_04210 [Nocardia amikacinitolerans]|uniref:DUF6414 family protein n=1 Tax=Nocardia amikacinitolerans TaxID=756689 RepID=UPI0036B0A699
MDVLREYLYVDLEKVKGLASQLYEGVPEASEESRKKTAGGQIGSRNIAFAAMGRESDVMDRKAVIDALFPAIERDLEAEGYLEDISLIVDEAEKLYSGELGNDYPPGSLVRITAPGRLIDPRYFARAMAGFATAATGLQMLGSKPDLPTRRPGKQKSGQPRGGKAHDSVDDEGIPDIPDGFDMDSSQIRAMVKIMRGMYPEGVSLALSPTGVEGPAVSVRLQEGRQHLDADPQTLFARYGLGLQEWTVVGTIGHHAVSRKTDLEGADFTDAGGLINRGKMTAFVNDFLETMATIGVVEMPQAPGFSVVPVAVYRVIPRLRKTQDVHDL